jgi:hypothetical protein
MNVNMKGKALTNRSDKLTGSSWIGSEVENYKCNAAANEMNGLRSFTEQATWVATP